MFFSFPALFTASHAAAAAVTSHHPQASSEASNLDQDAYHISTFINSRDLSQAFTLIAIGDLSAPLKIENWGFAKIAVKETRAVDTFILDGNSLLSNNRNGHCYISPDHGYLACEDVPEGVPQMAKDFSLARNGSLVYNGTANWWACPFQNPNVYDVYYQKISPYCKFVQLQSGVLPKTKRSPFEHSVKTIPSNHTKNLDARIVLQKTCFFHMRVPYDPDGFLDLNEKLRKDFPYTLLGKRLGTGPNGFHYCYINAATFQLVCADKASEELMENFHSIDFGINGKGYLMHNGMTDWVFCKTSKGWDGPYSEKKISDLKCEAVTVQIMATTIPGYDCRPQVVKPHIMARADTVSEAPLIACPTNLADTLFKSPTLLVSISSESNTKAYGAAKNISITPTRSTVFNFNIPSTKPYKDKECALLLLLPEIDYLSIDYKEGQIPGLQFYEVGGPVNEHTTFDTLPVSPLMVSKTFPNEIRSGKNNFITSLACRSGLMSIVISSRGGLSVGVRQEGVPNESGLYLVPCVEKMV